MRSRRPSRRWGKKKFKMHMTTLSTVNMLSYFNLGGQRQTVGQAAAAAAVTAAVVPVGAPADGQAVKAAVATGDATAVPQVEVVMAAVPQLVLLLPEASTSLEGQPQRCLHHKRCLSRKLQKYGTCCP